MIKSELVEKLYEKLADIGINKSRATAIKVVDVFFKSIKDQLMKGDRVELRHFGAFTVRSYGEKIGRNPKTGEKIVIPARKQPFWKTGLKLKQRIDN